MDVIFLGVFVTLAILVITFISYSFNTSKIIKSQEQEIEILVRDNERLKRAINGAKYVTKITLDPERATPERLKAIIKLDSIQSKIISDNDLFKE